MHHATKSKKNFTAAILAGYFSATIGLCIAAEGYRFNLNIHQFNFLLTPDVGSVCQRNIYHFENLQSWLWVFRIRAQLLCQP